MELDLTLAVDRVRLSVGDISDLEIFPDSVYQQILEQNDNNEFLATQIIAQNILVLLSFNGRERLDRIEIYGNQVFEQYRTALKEVIKNPAGRAMGGIFVGGASKSQVAENLTDPDRVSNDLPDYDYRNNDDTSSSYLV